MPYRGISKNKSAIISKPLRFQRLQKSFRFIDKRSEDLPKGLSSDMVCLINHSPQGTQDAFLKTYPLLYLPKITQKENLEKLTAPPVRLLMDQFQ